MKPDPALLKEIESDIQSAPPADKLELIRDKIKETIELEYKINDLETQVGELKRMRRDLMFDNLPSMFMQIGVNRIGIDSQGNQPAFEAKLQDHFHAVIGADWPANRRNAAFKWCKRNKLEDIIKTNLTVEFGRGQSKILKRVLTALKKLKVRPVIQETVPWTTLTAVVKERYKAGKPMSDHELKTVGASVNKIVKLTPVREK